MTAGPTPSISHHLRRPLICRNICDVGLFCKRKKEEHKSNGRARYDVRRAEARSRGPRALSRYAIPDFLRGLDGDYHARGAGRRAGARAGRGVELECRFEAPFSACPHARSDILWPAAKPKGKASCGVGLWPRCSRPAFSFVVCGTADYCGNIFCVMCVGVWSLWSVRRAPVGLD